MALALLLLATRNDASFLGQAQPAPAPASALAPAWELGVEVAHPVPLAEPPS